MTSPRVASPVPADHPLPSGVVLRALHWAPTAESTGTTFVLTHGLASNARLWDGVAAHLVTRGHRVVTVDQRGHGQSSKPDDGYDVPTCADDLAHLVEELDLDARPIVGGQSWGGNVVLELGHRRPDVVSQIICVDGGFIDLQEQFPAWPEARSSLAPPRLAGTPKSQIEAWLQTSAGDWPAEGRTATLANFEELPDGTVAPWLTFDRHLLVLRGLWEHRPSSRYQSMQVPVLLVVADSGEAAWTSSKQAAVDAAVAAIPSARAEWFRPAHHDVHAQKPDAVAALLHAAASEPDFYPPPTSTEGETST